MQLHIKFGRISYRFGYIDAFSSNTVYLVFTTPPLYDAPVRGNPLEFLDET